MNCEEVLEVSKDAVAEDVFEGYLLFTQPLFQDTVCLAWFKTTVKNGSCE